MTDELRALRRDNKLLRELFDKEAVAVIRAAMAWNRHCMPEIAENSALMRQEARLTKACARLERARKKRGD